MGRHAEHQHSRALQPFLDLRRNALARLEQRFIKPQPESGLSKPLCKQAHDRLVLRAVAQEHVVLELLWHGVMLRCSNPQASQHSHRGVVRGRASVGSRFRALATEPSIRRREEAESAVAYTCPPVPSWHSCEGGRDAGMATSPSRNSPMKAEAQWPASLQRMF